MTTYIELNDAKREHIIDMACKTGYTGAVILWATDILSDRLDGMEGRKICVCDLAYELTNNENCDGYVDSPYTIDAKEWIVAHYDDCGVAYDDMKYDYDSNTPNPFDEPVRFQLYVYMEIVKAIVRHWDWTEEHYDEEVTLTPEIIAILKRELWGDDND